MQAEESAKIWCVPHLNGLPLLRATFITYAFKRHAHDYFVIGMIEEGVQKFACQRHSYITPPTGIIVINPGEAHTGEAAAPSGFRYRAFYPEAEVLRQISSEVKECNQDIPSFASPVVQDAFLFEQIRRFHLSLEGEATLLEHESRYLWVLAQLIIRHSDTHPSIHPIKRERREIKRIRAYIEARYAEDIKLHDLATLVHWSPYYLLRVFKAETGLTPHAFVETVRIRAAQRLLKTGLSIAQTAYDTGFSSQSHFTTTFKGLIGVTPGHYAKEVNFLKDDSPPEALL